MSEQSLIDAVKAEDTSAVMGLINSGADINQQDENGWTSLNWAAGKGNLDIVKLLIEREADIFKVGRDQRTPYKIALAAGRADVARVLRDAENQSSGEKPPREARPYCKAYYLSDFQKFPLWAAHADQQGGEALPQGENGSDAVPSEIGFLHQDYTVTRSIWHNEDIIFDQVTPHWIEFCTTTLQFKVPDDLDLIGEVSNSADQGN